jgi:ribose 1,5-bisphosphokinase PhnN
MPDKNECNFYVDEHAFTLLKESDFFIADWGAHGNLYGVSWNEFRPPSDGVRIVSVSRTVIPVFEKKLDEVYTILVTAPRSTLLERIQRRRRESVPAMASRLDRVDMDVTARQLHRFDNSDPLPQTVPRFLDLLDSIIGENSVKRKPYEKITTPNGNQLIGELATGN